MTVYCTSNFHSPLIQEKRKKEKFVSKFACCLNLIWQFGIDFSLLRLFFSMYFVVYRATICMTNKRFPIYPRPASGDGADVTRFSRKEIRINMEPIFDMVTCV